MPTHNCNDCNLTAMCPIFSIAPWLNDHEQEAKDAFYDEKVLIAKTCTMFEMISSINIADVDPESLVKCVEYAFLIGYYKGRTFPAVPAVFDEPFGG